MSQMHNYFTSEFLASGSSFEHFNFINKLAHTKSKTEEVGLVEEELEALSGKMSSPDVPSSRMKEYLIRLIHCHMLGYDVDFSIIYAIMATQSGETDVDRRNGYLACILFLEKNHELGILLINTLLRDLKSQNYFAVCAALNAVSYLEHEEMLDNVLDFVIQATDFPKQIVRKKATVALYSLYKGSGGNAERIETALRKGLTDKDTSVVLSSLSVWKMILMEHGASRFRDLLPVFFAIHRQIIDKRIHRSFNYHGVMAPWAQLDCLKIYSTYYESNIGSPQEFYKIILDCLAAVEKNFDMAFAIVLDCVKFLASIDPILLGTLSVPDENPFQILVPYLQASNHNLIYLGLTGLTYVDKSFWKKSWLDGTLIANIIRTSYDDNTILAHSLELFDGIMSEEVLRNITSGLLEALSGLHDSKENSSMVAYWLANRLTEYLGPKDAWFINTFIDILAEARKILDEEYVGSKCSLLKGTLMNETDNTSMRAAAVNKAYSLLKRTNSNVFSPLLVQFLFWNLGENGYLSKDVTDIDIMKQLQKWVVLVEDEYLQAYGLQAIKKCIIRSNIWLSELDTILAASRMSTLPEKQTIALDLITMLKDSTFERLLQESSIPSQVENYFSRNPNRPTGIGRFISDQEDNDTEWSKQQLSPWSNSVDKKTISSNKPVMPIARTHRGNTEDEDFSYRINPLRQQERSELISSLLEFELNDENEAATMISTDKFGQLWLRYPCELKKRFDCSLSHARKLAKRLRKLWNINIVQIEGEEFLAVENNDKVANMVLLHAAMISDNMFELTLRSEQDEDIDRFLLERKLR